MLRTCFSTVPSVTHSRCAPLGHERQHLALARAEVVEWILEAARGDELPHERRVDHRAAVDDAIEVLEEVVDVGDPALQQVTGSLAAGEQIHRVIDLGVGGEDEDRDLR
jgi:hypothetical protein